MDRAVLVREPSRASVDLSIYLAAGDDKSDTARKPDILKKDIADAIIVAFQDGGRDRSSSPMAAAAAATTMRRR